MGNRNSRKKEIFGEKKPTPFDTPAAVFSIIIVIPYVWLARGTDKGTSDSETAQALLLAQGVSWITSEQKREGEGNYRLLGL